MVGFTVSHIIQHHNILWSCPFQLVNPKVMIAYIYVVGVVMLFVFNSSDSYLKVKYPYNSSYSCLDFI